MAKSNKNETIKAGEQVFVGQSRGIALASDADSGSVVVMPKATEPAATIDANGDEYVPLPPNAMPQPEQPSAIHELAAAKKATALIEIMLVDVPESGHTQRGFHFTLSSHLARKLKLLRLSLHAAGVTYYDGRIKRHVDRPHDVIGYLLEQFVLRDSTDNSKFVDLRELLDALAELGISPELLRKAAAKFEDA